MIPVEAASSMPINATVTARPPRTRPNNREKLRIKSLVEVTEEKIEIKETVYFKTGSAVIDLASWTGVHSGLPVDETATYLPGEYAGPDADEIIVLFRFRSIDLILHGCLGHLRLTILVGRCGAQITFRGG